MLDVHVLVMDYTDPDQLARCKQSIASAVELAGYPVRVHYIPGIYGHLGAARYRGYSQGDYPYVTHVDDDDYIDPQAFAELLPLMQQGVDAITTGETWVVNDVETTPAPYSRHHLAVYRREVMVKIPYRQFRFYPDQFLMRQIPGQHIPKCLYFLRVSDHTGSRRCRRENRDEAKQEERMLDRPDLVASEVMSKAQIDALYDDWLNEQQ